MSRLSRLLCAFVALLTSVASAQQPLQTLLVGADRRTVTSLNGDWHYLIDQTGNALYARDGKIKDDGYALNHHPDLTGERRVEEYDFATAPTMKIPGDWNTQDKTIFHYEGVVWFQRDFNYQPKGAKRTFLHIGAANYRSHVWVNQKRVCDHEGGFTPFDCEVTAVLHPGSNFVVIAVDSSRSAEGIPGLTVDWYNYGGLTRDVSLIELPTQFIDDYDVHLKRGSTTGLAGYVHVVDAVAGTPVSLNIPEAGVSLNLKTDANGTASFDAEAKLLDLWSPEKPRLYGVNLAAGADKLTDSIGFREVRVDGTNILINGKPVFLRGVNSHAEAPYRLGRVNTDKDVENIFGFLRDLNANFVRLCHYPQDERMERYADKVGVMVWSEIPIWQSINYASPEVYKKAVTMVNEMIRRDRNKASVILWSVSNETPNNATRTEFLTNLANEARRADATRPITSAFLQPPVVENVVKFTDPLAAALDVIGVNEYIGWYNKKAEDADNITWELPQKPILISEFGAEAKQGVHGDIHQRWAEEQQANFYRHNFIMLGKIPQVRGYMPWVLMDFRSPTRNVPLLQDGFNRKGLISEDGKKKQAFFLFQKLYKEKAAAGQ